MFESAMRTYEHTSLCREIQYRETMVPNRLKTHVTCRLALGHSHDEHLVLSSKLAELRRGRQV